MVNFFLFAVRFLQKEEFRKDRIKFTTFNSRWLPKIFATKCTICAKNCDILIFFLLLFDLCRKKNPRKTQMEEECGTRSKNIWQLATIKRWFGQF